MHRALSEKADNGRSADSWYLYKYTKDLSQHPSYSIRAPGSGPRTPTRQAEMQKQQRRRPRNVLHEAGTRHHHRTQDTGHRTQDTGHRRQHDGVCGPHCGARRHRTTVAVKRSIGEEPLTWRNILAYSLAGGYHERDKQVCYHLRGSGRPRLECGWGAVRNES